MAFQLPPKVSSQKVRLSGGWAYIFHHTDLGQLGRIVLRPNPDGRTIASTEITGDKDSPIWEKRRAIFEPIGTDLVNALGNTVEAMGRPKTETLKNPPKPLSGHPRQVETKRFNCKKCGADVGLIIFADVGEGTGVLEDAAMIMYQEIQRLNVPTWVIGEISGEGNPMKNKGKILKVHPQRESIFEASPEEFNSILDALENEHC